MSRRVRGPVGGTPAERLEAAARVTAACAAVTRWDRALSDLLASIDVGRAAVAYAANHAGDQSAPGFTAALNGLSAAALNAPLAIQARENAENEREAAWNAWVALVGKDQRPGAFGGASLDPWELAPDGSFQPGLESPP